MCAIVTACPRAGGRNTGGPRQLLSSAPEMWRDVATHALPRRIVPCDRLLAQVWLLHKVVVLLLGRRLLIAPLHHVYLSVCKLSKRPLPASSGGGQADQQCRWQAGFAGSRPRSNT